MGHPLRHSGEIERVDASEDSGELEDIWVRQGIPEDDLSAKSLNGGVSITLIRKRRITGSLLVSSLCQCSW